MRRLADDRQEGGEVLAAVSLVPPVCVDGVDVGAESACMVLLDGVHVVLVVDVAYEGDELLQSRLDGVARCDA